MTSPYIPLLQPLQFQYTNEMMYDSFKKPKLPKLVGPKVIAYTSAHIGKDIKSKCMRDIS
ncbi:hypothetical protein D9742_00015 [Escherichia sp. E1V33]|nr:hypothetical protein D9742_00015 [Escherichia sp. E1V33]TBR68277.1 hypothetical protein D9735_07440 [Escherichia sp. E1S7]